MNAGICQGDPLSTALWCMTFQSCINELAEHFELTVFADDMGMHLTPEQDYDEALTYAA